MSFWYNVADVFFVVFHTAYVLFNLFGWIFRTTRKANLLCLFLTALSWFVLGIWYGWGYCFLTDWHWTILDILGKSDIPSSYIQYLIMRLTGIDIGAIAADAITLAGFVTALVLSVFLNWKDYKKRA